jgi:hypothetical protein
MQNPAMTFDNITINVKRLGPDFAGTRLKAGMVLKGPTLTYHILKWDPARRVGTIQVDCQDTKMLEKIETDPVLERQLSNDWLAQAPDDPRNRKMYLMTMVDLVSEQDARCIYANLGRAIVNGHNDETMHFNCIESLIARLGPEEALKPLAVCVQCGLHTPRKLRQCTCRRGFFFCAKECQKAHWDAGHALDHSVDVD